MQFTFESKKIKTLLFDLETTGLPTVKKNMLNILPSINNKIISMEGEPDIKIEEVFEDENSMFFKNYNELYQVNKNEMTLNKTTLPIITSYGYINTSLESPSYVIDNTAKTVTVKYKNEQRVFKCQKVKAKQTKIFHFIEDNGNVYVVKNNLVYQRKLVGKKSVDVPLFDYMADLKNDNEGVLFYSIPTDKNVVFSPEASALTRLYQQDLLLQMTDKTVIKDWLDRFKSKIDTEEKGKEFPIFDVYKMTSENIWKDVFAIMEKEYQFKELSKFPLWTKDDYKKIFTMIEEADIIVGHNHVGFDLPLMTGYDSKLVPVIKDKILFDTMTMPIKLKSAKRTQNLNAALKSLNDKKNKKMTDEQRQEIDDLHEERTLYHDALLDLKATILVYKKQFPELYKQADSENVARVINYNIRELKEAKAEAPVHTLIGIPTDYNGYAKIAVPGSKKGSIELSPELSNLLEYDNIGTSNIVLNDFNDEYKVLEKLEKKNIITFKIYVDDMETIAVLSNPEDQKKIELLLDENRSLSFDKFKLLLNGNNTINFLMLPEFENKYKMTHDRIFIRVDPYINADYAVNFNNKRILTVSPMTGDHDINKYLNAVIYQTVKDNEVLTGEVDYINMLSKQPVKYMLGVPSKKELAAVFPIDKFADIYKNADDLAAQCQTFHLYTTNKREEFPDLEKLFDFELPEGDTEKDRWRKFIENKVEDFLQTDKFKAMLYFNIMLKKGYPFTNEFYLSSNADKIEFILSLKDEIKKYKKDYEASKVVYIDRFKTEIDVFDNMEAGEELSIFYYKYLALMHFVIEKIYKPNGIVIGPGRGSVGGCFVAFALNISQVDPIPHGTIFSRFTNKPKTSKPDIDTDHSDRTKALEAIETFLKEHLNDIFDKNGEYLNLLDVEDLEEVASEFHISTENKSQEDLKTELSNKLFGHLNYCKGILNIVDFTKKTFFAGLGKALGVRDMRKLQMSFDENKGIVDNIEALTDERLKSYFSKIPMSVLIEFDKKENMMRNMGVHASGNIIFSELHENIHNNMKKVTPFTERGEMPEKLDILGLMTLEIMIQYRIMATVKKLNETYNLNINNYELNEFIKNYNTKMDFHDNFTLYFKEIELDRKIIDNIYAEFDADYIFTNYNDMDILKMLKEGNSGGIFQMDEKVQRRLLYNLLSSLEIGKKEHLPSFMNIDILTILTIINAVNRPGPLSAGMGDEIIINFRNAVIEELFQAGKLDEYKDHEYFKREISKFIKNDFKVISFSQTGRFREFWKEKIDEERAIMTRGEASETIITKYIREEKSNEEIIDIFVGFDQKIKNLPVFQKMTESSFRTILYQETIMQMSQELSGFDDALADKLRGAIGKKNMPAIAECIEKFINGSEKIGLITKEEADYIGILFVGFGSYCFNKAHALAYSLISYQTASQKVREPQLFYAANFNLAKQVKVGSMVGEIMDNDDMGMAVADINDSQELFCVNTNKELIIPITAYKGITDKASAKIISELKNNGHFTSLYDLYNRCYPHLDKSTFSTLANCGLLNNLIKQEGVTIKSVVENVEVVFAEIKASFEKLFPKKVGREKQIGIIEKAQEELNILTSDDINEEDTEILIKKNALLTKIEKANKELAKIDKKEQKEKSLVQDENETNVIVYNLEDLLSPDLLKILKKSKIEYTDNDFRINRYELLKNFNPDNITVNMNELERLNEDMLKGLKDYSNNAYNGNDLIPFNDEFKRIYGTTINHDLSPMYVGKNPKVVLFVDYIQDKKLMELFSLNGETYAIGEDLGKPFYYNVTNSKDTVWTKNENVISKLEFKGEEFSQSEPGKPFYASKKGNRGWLKTVGTKKAFCYKENSETVMDENFKILSSDYVRMVYKKDGKGIPIGHTPDQYKVLQEKDMFVVYIEEIFKNSGINLENFVILPAYPFTKKEYDEMKKGGVKLEFGDSLFVDRVKNILSRNEIQFAMFTNTMNSKAIRKATKAGDETDINIGKTYLLYNNKHITTCLQIPTIEQGLRASKSVAIDAINNTFVFEEIQHEPEEEANLDLDNSNLELDNSNFDDGIIEGVIIENEKNSKVNEKNSKVTDKDDNIKDNEVKTVKRKKGM